MGCCCSQIQPVHTDNESTIVFDSGICYCGINPRLAAGNPLVCTRTEYDSIAEKASGLGMNVRICCEANCCGTPCCGHGWPLDQYAQDLQRSFPQLDISIYDSYEGCDDQGHWEFVIVIRRRHHHHGRALSIPVQSQTMAGSRAADGSVVTKVTTETVYKLDGSKTVTETIEKVAG